MLIHSKESENDFSHVVEFCGFLFFDFVDKIQSVKFSNETGFFHCDYEQRTISIWIEHMEIDLGKIECVRGRCRLLWSGGQYASF